MIRATLFALGLLLSSCGHTNNLAQFPVHNSTMAFRYTHSGLPTASAYIPAHHPLAGIAAEIGSSEAEMRARIKIERATVPDSLSSAVSCGVEQAIKDYLHVRTVSADEATFLVETDLEEYRLRSNPEGIFAEIEASTRILDRATGKIVWEDKESTSLPLSAGIHGHPPFYRGTWVGAINAVALADLSEEEIALLLTEAARRAGLELGEMLRTDVAELPA